MSILRAILLVLRKDLFRKVRAPLASIVMLLFPVLFSLLIGVTFGGGGMPPIKLALVDDDHGLLARLLRSSFSQSQISQSFDIQLADSAKAMRLIEANKVSSVLRVPPGFSDSLLASKPTRLELVKNPAKAIEPQIVERYVAVLAQLGSAVIRLLGGPIGEIRGAIETGEPASDTFVSDVSLAIHHKMEAVGRYAFPPAIRLEKPKAAGDDGGDSGVSPLQIAVFMLPGMAVFALMMLALVSMSDFQREGARGTLARQFVTPIPFSAVVLGKIGATWIQSGACIVILALVATLWAKSGVSVVGFLTLSLLFALAATGFAAFVQSLSRSERTGSAIGSILIMVMTMISGSWIPLDSLPEVARRIAPFTLTYWGSQGYRDLMFESASVAQLLPNLAILFLTGAVLSLVAIVRFRRRYGSGV